MDRNNDECLRISLRAARVVATWVLISAGLSLLGWGTVFGGPVHALIWGVAVMTAGETLALLHCFSMHYRLVREAFDLGVTVGRRQVSPVN